MSLQNNIDKLIFRENEIENLLVNSSELNPNELAELSKELSEIKLITDLTKKKDLILFVDGKELFYHMKMINIFKLQLDNLIFLNGQQKII